MSLQVCKCLVLLFVSNALARSTAPAVSHHFVSNPYFTIKNEQVHQETIPSTFSDTNNEQTLLSSSGFLNQDSHSYQVKETPSLREPLFQPASYQEPQYDQGQFDSYQQEPSASSSAHASPQFKAPPLQDGFYPSQQIAYRPSESVSRPHFATRNQKPKLPPGYVPLPAMINPPPGYQLYKKQKFNQKYFN